MPVLIVAADFVKTGGMDRANYALAHYLASRPAPPGRSDRVHLVAHRASPDLAGRPGVELHAVNKPLGSTFLGGPSLDRAGRRWAARIAAQGGRVIVNGGNCRFGDVNWVHYVHAAYTPDIAGNALRKARWMLAHRTYLRDERLALRSARLVIVNSERTKRDVTGLLGIPAARVHCVYLGVDPTLFAPASAPQRAAARAALGWDSRPVVTFIGGLGDRRKGFDTLYSAWKKLAADPAWEADLAVAGSGAEMPEWQARAAADGLAARIRFLGFRRDIPAVLAASDALAAPTRYEAYGMAVLEALCMGLPALVSRGAGVAERYPGSLGDLLISNPADPDELAARLRSWRSRDAHFRSLVGELGARLRLHTWDKMGEEFMAAVDANR